MPPETKKEEIKTLTPEQELLKTAQEFAGNNEEQIRTLEENLDKGLKNPEITKTILTAMDETFSNGEIKPEKAKDYRNLLNALDPKTSIGTDKLTAAQLRGKIEKGFETKKNETKKAEKEARSKEKETKKETKENDKEGRRNVEKKINVTSNKIIDINTQMKKFQEEQNKTNTIEQKSVEERKSVLTTSRGYVTTAENNKTILENQKVEVNNGLENTNTKIIDTKKFVTERITERAAKFSDSTRSGLNNYIKNPLDNKITNKDIKKMIEVEKDLTKEQKNILITNMDLLEQLSKDQKALTEQQTNLNIGLDKADNDEKEAKNLLTTMETRYDTEGNKIKDFLTNHPEIITKDPKNYEYYGKIITRDSITSDKGIETRKNNQDNDFNNKINALLPSNPTHEYAETFFEKISENEYNYIFDKVAKGDNDTITQQMKRNLLNLVRVYPKTNLSDKTEFNLKKADENSPFEKGTRMIQFPRPNKEGVIQTITRGSQDKMQERKASKYIPTTIDRTQTNTINTFDDKGNFKAFEKYLKDTNRSTTEIAQNLPNIVKQITAYNKDQTKKVNDKDMPTDDSFEDINGLKNGYANVMTNFILEKHDNELTRAYISYLTPEHITILGVDPETQNANLTKITSSALFKSLNIKDKTTLTNIKNLSEVINGQPKGKLEATMNKGIDAVIKLFGKDFVMGLLEMFGGKGFLKKFCKRFKLDYDKTFASIDKLYKEKYGLDDPQKDLLKKQYEALKGTPGTDNINGVNKKPVKCDKDEIKKSYKEAFKDEKNFNLLDPNLVLNALSDMKITNNSYVFKNKYGKYEINATLLKDAKDTDGKTVGLEGIYANIIGKNKIRDKVQEAGDIVGNTDSIYNSKNEGKDAALENKTADDKKKMQGINDAGDVALYYGAFLMKGSANLAYVRTENPMEGEENRLDALKNAETAAATAPAETAEAKKAKEIKTAEETKAGIKEDVAIKNFIYKTIKPANARLFKDGNFDQKQKEPIPTATELVATGKIVDKAEIKGQNGTFKFIEFTYTEKGSTEEQKVYVAETNVENTKKKKETTTPVAKEVEPTTDNVTAKK